MATTAALLSHVPAVERIPFWTARSRIPLPPSSSDQYKVGFLDVGKCLLPSYCTPSLWIAYVHARSPVRLSTDPSELAMSLPEDAVIFFVTLRGRWGTLGWNVCKSWIQNESPSWRPETGWADGGNYVALPRKRKTRPGVGLWYSWKTRPSRRKAVLAKR